MLTEDSIFGGILIRGIEPVEALQLPEGAVVKLDGPKKACFHLFDQFSAIAQDNTIPRLEPSAIKKKRLQYLSLLPVKAFPMTLMAKSRAFSLTTHPVT